MKKTERIQTLETVAYVLALTAARDNNATQEQDKEVLKKIRNYIGEIIVLKNGIPNFTILTTVGMSETEALKIAKDFDKEEN